MLSEGKIRERGSHGGLMALGGECARLFRLQAGGYERAPEPSAGPGRCRGEPAHDHAQHLVHG
ncbi:hypothetical protein ACWEPN_35935 [Nonomuraea wenchangensis]